MRLTLTCLCLIAFLMYGTPAHASTPYTVKHGDTPMKIAKAKDVNVKTLMGMNRYSNTSFHPGSVVYIPTSSKNYTVRSGDTISKIASAHKVSYKAIMKINPQLKHVKRLYRGQIIDMPAASTAGTANPSHNPTGNTIKNDTTTSPKPSSNMTSVSGYASEVANIVNEERKKAGLPALKLDAALSNVAMAKAKDMIDKNYFDHHSPTYGSPFEMMKSFGISYTSAGENIAKGQSSPQAVMKDWMNSTGHRQNILSSKYDSIGVAYYKGAWVQLFKK